MTRIPLFISTEAVKILIHIFSDIESIKYYCCFDTFLTTVKSRPGYFGKKRFLPFTREIIVSPLYMYLLNFFAIMRMYTLVMSHAALVSVKN